MIDLGVLTYNVISGSFKFQIVTTTPNELFTLPISAGGSSYLHNFTVYWGDTTSSIVTSYNDPNREHTYATAGTYDVELVGTCQYFAFSSSTSANRIKVRKLLLFIGDIGFKTLNFMQCTNLNTIIPLGTLFSLTDVVNLFNGCNLITAIPNGMFDTCPNIINFTQTFYGCNNVALTTIPTDLFKYNVSATIFSNTFAACVNITSIPVDLFRYNTAVYDFTGTFSGLSKITSIPVDLFKYNTATTVFTGVFNACTLLVTIPVDLFRYNTLVYTFNSAFSACTNLVIIPVDIFKYNISVTDFRNVFYFCSKITSIPVDLFRYNTIAIYFINAFYNCIALTTIPVDLFRYNLSAVNFSYTFYGCVKARYNINIFYATGEEGTRFLNKSINFLYCFYRTSFSGIQGDAPNLWNCNFGTGTPFKTYCYGGAGNSLTSLSNYASIPAEWK